MRQNLYFLTGYIVYSLSNYHSYRHLHSPFVHTLCDGTYFLILQVALPPSCATVLPFSIHNLSVDMNCIMKQCVFIMKGEFCQKSSFRYNIRRKNCFIFHQDKTCPDSIPLPGLSFLNLPYLSQNSSLNTPVSCTSLPHSYSHRSGRSRRRTRGCTRYLHFHQIEGT